MAFGPTSAGMCPHCRTGVRFEVIEVFGMGAQPQQLGEQRRLRLRARSSAWLDIIPASCPNCGRVAIAATNHGRDGNPTREIGQLLWPDGAERPVPVEVEAEDATLAEDFREAVSVFPKSKKASAALSRRCLQRILSTKGGSKKRDLADQIEEVLAKLPPEIAANVDAIRQVGNFAAHPMKSTSSGEIVDVEEGEAEWLLEVLEELFGHYYVAPARAAARREALNKKLEDLGKPTLKQPKG